VINGIEKLDPWIF